MNAVYLPVLALNLHVYVALYQVLRDTERPSPDERFFHRTHLFEALSFGASNFLLHSFVDKVVFYCAATPN